jgi:hypothetical protein
MPRRLCVRAGAAVGLAVLLLTVWPGTVCTADGPPMVEFRTAHYEVRTDAGFGMARLIAAHMEEIHAEYVRRFEGYRGVEGGYQVVVYRNEADYRHSLPASLWGSNGVFVSSDSRLAAHMEGRTVEEVLRTLYHEGFHQFMFCAVSRDCPIWLNEGLAEYFSEATWNGHGFVTGLVPMGRLLTVQEAVRQGSYVPFRRLFAMPLATWVSDCRGDAHTANLYYCEAWSIVQFLAHADGQRYAGMLNGFLKAISDGADPEQALQQSFGTDIVAFEQAWARYIVGLKPSAKFVCRDNMRAIMLLAQAVYEDPRQFKSLPRLRRELLHGRRAWQLTRPDGQTLRSDDTEQVDALFRCPFGNTDRDVAYLLVPNRQTGMPTLVYNELPGIVITAYYKQQPTGQVGVVVEELVRDTVPAADMRRLDAAQAAQFN